jgi:hypothetical protein
VIVFPWAVRRPEKTNDKETKVGRASQINERKGAETQLTFDLLSLRVEGLARFLGLLPLVTDRGLLLLEGLC